MGAVMSPKPIWPILGAAALFFFTGAVAVAAVRARPALPGSPATPGAAGSGSSILRTIGLRVVLSPTQAHAATAIAIEAQRANSNWIPFTQGLIANAWAESGQLNPRAIGDSGLSYGLFQLHTTKGLGVEALRTYSHEQLLDPVVNARFFVGVCLRTGSVLRAIQSGSAEAVTRAVCIDVERPAYATEKAEQRVGYLRMLFG
jgi:hypothetical protein